MLTLALSLAAYAFDGRKWNVSTGNLSVGFISNSPIGAHPQAGYAMEPPPSVESLVDMKKRGLVAYEDYVAWGAVEREPGKWDWRQHDAICDAIRTAGLHYVVYNWTHFPPTWLRASKSVTLLRCVEHKQETNYFSIFDPRTVEHFDHYYRALSEHFGDRIDGVYACINGPYGEGNYPLDASAWVVGLGHCHEGYWCADPYAVSAFQDAMRAKYENIAALNLAWGGSARSFEEIKAPHEIADGIKPSLQTWKTAQDRRRWLDFITWYHQAMIDFAESAIQVTLKHFPREKVRTKPGGNAGGVNPIAWGTYCPGYAKMAAKYGIVLQPADCHGAYFGDKWISTAYKFYGVPLSTEPAGGMDEKTFVRRMFSDASCGASQIFTYEFDGHSSDIQKYAHLYTGKSGDTDVAVLCPTTLYRLGGDLWPMIGEADRLRELTDYDVLDEMLVLDGALGKRYRTTILFEPEFIEQAVLDRIESWIKSGGRLVVFGKKPIQNIDGVQWAAADGVGTRRLGRGDVVRIEAFPKDNQALEPLRRALPAIGTESSFDGVWVTRRGREVLILNKSDSAVTRRVTGGGKARDVTIRPWTIAELKPDLQADQSAPKGEAATLPGLTASSMRHFSSSLPGHSWGPARWRRRSQNAILPGNVKCNWGDDLVAGRGLGDLQGYHGNIVGRFVAGAALYFFEQALYDTLGRELAVFDEMSLQPFYMHRLHCSPGIGDAIGVEQKYVALSHDNAFRPIG